MRLPIDLVERLRMKYHLDTFFETGTYLGETALWAAERFDPVITIEKSEELHTNLQADLRIMACSNIFLVLGDSGEYLTSGITISGISRVMFWLDAHWSGGVTVGRDAECPLSQELAGIVAMEGLHFILIDDAHLFTRSEAWPLIHNPTHWPHYDDIESVLTASGYAVKIVGDVIVAVPPNAIGDVY